MGEPKEEGTEQASIVCELYAIPRWIRTERYFIETRVVVKIPFRKEARHRSGFIDTLGLVISKVFCEI